MTHDLECVHLTKLQVALPDILDLAPTCRTGSKDYISFPSLSSSSSIHRHIFLSFKAPLSACPQPLVIMQFDVNWQYAFIALLPHPTFTLLVCKSSCNSIPVVKLLVFVEQQWNVQRDAIDNFDGSDESTGSGRVKKDKEFSAPPLFSPLISSRCRSFGSLIKSPFL